MLAAEGSTQVLIALGLSVLLVGVVGGILWIIRVLAARPAEAEAERRVRRFLDSDDEVSRDALGQLPLSLLASDSAVRERALDIVRLSGTLGAPQRGSARRTTTDARAARALELAALARTLFRKHDYKAALQAVNESIALDPSNAHAFVLKGETLKAIQDYPGALAAYTKAIELDSNEHDARLGRASVLFHLNRLDEGIQDLSIISDATYALDALGPLVWPSDVAGQVTGTSTGRVIVVAGPSGLGKREVLHELQTIRGGARVWLSVSDTTRPRRGWEVNGSDYTFIDSEEFTHRIDLGRYLEFARVLGHWYGVPRRELIRHLAEGDDVVLDLTVWGAVVVHTQIPGALLVFLQSPDAIELAERIRQSGLAHIEVADSLIERLKRLPSVPGHVFHAVHEDDPQEAAQAISRLIDSEGRPVSVMQLR
jgi:guanylate kinase